MKHYADRLKDSFALWSGRKDEVSLLSKTPIYQGYVDESKMKILSVSGNKSTNETQKDWDQIWQAIGEKPPFKKVPAGMALEYSVSKKQDHILNISRTNNTVYIDRYRGDKVPEGKLQYTLFLIPKGFAQAKIDYRKAPGPEKKLGRKAW